MSRTAAVVLALALSVAAGCGSGDEAAVAPETSPTATAAVPGGPGETTPSPAATPGDPLGPPAQAPDQAPVATQTLPPVGLREDATFGDGLVAVVSGVEEVELESTGPGETAGPGVAVTVELRNDGNAAVDLGGLVVNASYGDGTPAIPNDSPPASPLDGRLPPGEARSGIYAFRLPPGESDSLVVELQHSAFADIVVIEM